MIKKALDQAAIGHGMSVLDIGCGTGVLLDRLGSTYGTKGIGIDISRKSLDAANAQKVKNSSFVLAEARALPFADGSIDLVTSRVSAHHFRDFEKALDEARRVLKNGGSLLMADSVAPEDDAITEWMNDIELRRDFSHVENRQISAIARMLEERGFTVVENDYPRIYLRFNEWTSRTKVSPEETEALRKDFLQAPAATREAFQVAPVHDDIAFSWPCWVFRAVKG
ncbi:MAG: class I SAM-dependent methyltransferase [Chloroflexi bacterium]|nr:class I SAM-dependent methyltransferase [Chloroflexota bacterium]